MFMGGHWRFSARVMQVWRIFKAAWWVSWWVVRVSLLIAQRTDDGDRRGGDNTKDTRINELKLRFANNACSFKCPTTLNRYNKMQNSTIQVAP